MTAVGAGVRRLHEGGRLGQAAGAALGCGRVRQVFDEMVGKVGELQGQAARWGRETRPIQLRFANSRG